MHACSPPMRPRLAGLRLVLGLGLALVGRVDGVRAQGPPAPAATAPALGPEIHELLDPRVPAGAPGSRRPLQFPAGGPVDSAIGGIGPRVTMGPLETGLESLFGDAYAKDRWRPLELGSFFTEGWDEAWANGPAGREGLTPRQGWLGSDAGLFYRLWHLNVLYAHQLGTSYGGDQYTSSYHIFLPLSRRLEVALDAPLVVANGTLDPRRGYASNFGDFLVVPRIILSDRKDACQLIALDIRTPTGSPLNGNGLLAVTPRYEFWTNPFGPWVLRSMTGIGVPLNRPEQVGNISYVVGIPSNRTSVPNQTTFHGNLALGRYFTPGGDLFGHLVLYTAVSWRIPLQGDISTTFVSVGPGFRFELAKDTYALGFVEAPLTAPRVVDYLMQFAIMRVF